MKYLIFVFSLFLVLPFAKSQTPVYQWAQGAGGTSGDFTEGIATDTNGNIYVTGSFRSSTITFGSTTLTSNGNEDIFLVKYDPSGNVIWAKSAGGTGNDRGNGIATDGNGNIYVTGYFDSPALTFGSFTLNNAGSFDVFTVKFDPNGNVIWAKSAGGPDSDFGTSITTDASGHVYVAGDFNSASIAFGIYTLTNNGNEDIFFAKYDAGGTVLGAKSVGGTGLDMGKCITTDASGNIYITGAFASPSISFGSYTLTNNGSFDAFTVKADTNGTVLWAQSAGGSGNDQGSSLSTDASGNVYVTGRFGSTTVAFGPNTLINNGSDDLFLVKYDTAGNVVWAKSAGGTGTDRAASLATGANGDIYITGYFDSPGITFGPTTLNNTNGGFDLFIAKYDTSGAAAWATGASAGQASETQGTGITVNSNGKIYVTGFYFGTAIIFGPATLTNNGLDDVFVVELSETPTSIKPSAQNDFSVFAYPNPVSHTLYLHFDKAYSHIMVAVNSITGREIYQATFKNRKDIPLDLNIEPGVYFISVKTNPHKKAVCRVVKY